MSAAMFPRTLTSAGDLKVGLVRDHRAPDRMRALLTFSDRSGRQIAVCPIELRDTLLDVVRLLTMDEAEVSRWWSALTALDDAGGNGYPRRRCQCLTERHRRR